METPRGVAGQVESIVRLVGIDRVFGKPEQIGGKTIVPVAVASWGGGMGFGKGEEPGSGDTPRSGQGGGGGGRVTVRPVAFLEVDASGTRVVPVIDRTRIILAGMVLVAWNVFWVAYTVRKIARRRRW